MKKIYFLLVSLLCIAFMPACKKNSTAPAIDYTVNYFDSINVYSGGTAYYPINITYNSGTKQPVTLTVSGLPANVTVTPSTVTVIPDSTFYFAFYASSLVTPGVYPITLTTSSKGTTDKTTKLYLAISADDYTTDFAGNYTGSDLCFSGSYHSVISVTGTNTISMSNFRGMGYSLKAYVADIDSITIPAQTVNNTTISGGGGYSSLYSNGGYIFFAYTLDSAGTHTSCEATLTKP